MAPLLTFEASSRAPYERLPSDTRAISASDDDDSVLDIDDGEENSDAKKVKKWWNYLPLCLLVILLTAPQYNILVLLVSYYLKIHSAPFLFVTHLSIIYTLTFLSFCSLLVLIVRDPGAIRVGEDATSLEQESEDENEETNILDALRMKPVPSKPRDDDFNAPHKWCRKCWAPKPERTHHCSVCDRCVLKMDHHCPWLAQKCVGYWTYTAFIHFLLCVTLLASYVCVVAGRIVYVAFLDPFKINERTALHGLFLTIYGAIFSLSMGSFMLWHVYLASTNQTTVENISPFLLLRYLPTYPGNNDTGATTPTQTSDPIPSNALNTNFQETNFQPGLSPRSDTASRDAHTRQRKTLSFTPREHQLTPDQRRHVRYAHGQIHLYDVGFYANWKQLTGVGSRGWRGWAYRILCGGGGLGDGKTFPRNPRAEGMLARLAAELANDDKSD